jgi:hypothetical protein
MNETTLNLINAIAEGDALETEKAFQAAMAEKISAKLEDMRAQVAQNMFKTVEEEKSSEEDDEDEDEKDEDEEDEKEIKENVEELDERDKMNALMRKMLDQERGERHRAKIPHALEPGPEHKTVHAHNRSIGRALRQMDTDSYLKHK